MNIASIDVGSNTVLITIAKINEDNSIQPLLNLYKAPRIGKGINENKIILPEKVSALKEVLLEYASIAKQYNCSKILCVGTSPFRNAQNSYGIVQEIKKSCDLEIKIISGEEEARLSFIGAVYDKYFDNLCSLIDIGGGSSEIIFGKGEKIFFKQSFDTGAIKITEAFLKDLRTSENIKRAEDYLNNYITFEPMRFEKCIAVAGTPTSLAAIKLNLKEYSDVLVDDSILTLNDINNFINVFFSLSPQEALNKLGQPLQGREDIILAGCLLLKRFMRALNCDEVIVSAKGLRYGLIFDFIKILNSK